MSTDWADRIHEEIMASLDAQVREAFGMPASTPTNNVLTYEALLEIRDRIFRPTLVFCHSRDRGRLLEELALMEGRSVTLRDNDELREGQTIALDIYAINKRAGFYDTRMPRLAPCSYSAW